MRPAQAQQHQRQSDVVVEVAFGLQHGRVGAGFHPQDGRQHFLHRGLAVAAGDGDDRNRETLAPGGGQPAKREPRVVDADGRVEFWRLRGVQHHAGCALLQGLGGESAAVELFAAQRDEEIARLDAAAVGADTQHLGIGTGKRHAEHGGGFGKLHHGHQVHASRAFPATATSENGNRAPATSW